MSASSDLNIAEREGGYFSNPSAVPKDMLDIAIQKWMEETGANGSDARVQIAMLAMRELGYMSQSPDCAHESATTADGHGAYCKLCGETLA